MLTNQRIIGVRVGILIVLVGAAALLFAIGVWASSGGVTPPEAPEIGEGIPPSALDRPALTPGERASAIEALENHEPLQTALDGVEYSLAKIGPWTGGTVKIGASLEIKLAEPIDASLDWPYIRYVGVKDEKAVYEKLVYSAKATGIVVLHSLVDLETKAVVALEAIEFETISYDDESDKE